MSSNPVSPPEFYLSLIGLSAIVGAGVSAVFNYFITLRVSRKQSEIKMIEEKLDLYSYIIFHLDKMRFKGEAIKELKGDTNGEEVYAYSATKNELEHVISLINDKIKDRYYLFKQDILKQWVYINTFLLILQLKIDFQNLDK